MLVVLVQVILCVENRYYYNHSSNRSTDTTRNHSWISHMLPVTFFGHEYSMEEGVPGDQAEVRAL